MAVSVTNQSAPLGNRIVQDTSADSSEASNTTGAAGTLYYLEVDNTANASTAVYLKLYDATGSVTIGTTAPTLIFRADAAQKDTCVFPTGLTFANGFTHACVTEPGTAGTTNPGSAVIVRYVTS